MPEHNRAVVERFFTEVVNNRNLDVIEEIYAEDLVWHGGGGFADLRGAKAFKDLAGGMLAAFPDLSATVEFMLGERDLVAVRFQLRGTHSGTFLGVQATGARVGWTGHPIYRVQDGRIVEEWFNEDALGLMRELGVLAL